MKKLFIIFLLFLIPSVYGLSDLTISFDDSFGDQIMYTGAYISFSIKVTNQGDEIAPESELIIKDVEVFGPETQMISELVPGKEKYSLPWTVIFKESGKQHAIIAIDPLNKVKESNEDNNEYVMNFEISEKPKSCEDPIYTSTNLCSSACGGDRGCDGYKPSTETFCVLNKDTISEGIYKCRCDQDCDFTTTFIKELGLSGEECELDEYCKNDKCINGICGGKIIEEKSSFWQKFIFWLKSMFS